MRLSGGAGAGDILDLTKEPTKKKGKLGPTLHGRGVAWSPDGKTLATVVVDKEGRRIQLWDDAGKPGKRLLTDPSVSGISTLTFTPDSARLLATWNQKPKGLQAGLFDVRTGKLVVKSSAKSPRSGAVSADGTLAATTIKGNLHGVTIWRTADGSVIREIAPRASVAFTSQHTGWLSGGAQHYLAWSARQSHLRPGRTALGGTMGEKKFQELTSKDFAGEKGGHALARLSGEQKTMIGSDLAATSHMGKITIHDLAAKKALRQLDGHQDEIVGLAPSADNKLLLSAAVDNMVKVWNIEQGKLLLTLYVNGKDWIVWTEQGYYAATPGGERLVGWKVDNGLDQPASFLPAKRFRKQLYRPDVVKLLVKEGTVAAAVKAADAALPKDETRFRGLAEPAKLLPPRAFLNVTWDKKTLPEVKVKVRAVASGSGQPVTGLRLFLDGRPLSKETSIDFATGKDKVEELEWTIRLPGEKPTGAYELAVLARGPQTSGVSETVAVPYVNPKNLPAMHVLAIGIDEYQNRALKLEAARKDADDIAAAFQNNAGKLFDKVEATTLLNDKATRQGVLDKLDEIRQKPVKHNDLVVVFFAGHGIKNAKGFYLLTVEADTSNQALIEKTCLPGADLRRKLGDFPCQVLLLLDACHSGAFGAGGNAGVLAKQGLKPATDDLTRSLTDDEIGVAVMCAAMGHEKAGERKGNGLFTSAVIKALGNAPGVHLNPFNHQLYVHHLQSYVFDMVSELSHGEQHPFLCLPWIVESFPLARFK